MIYNANQVPTPKQMEVLTLYAQGKSIPRIAQELGVSENAASSRFHSGLGKLAIPFRLAQEMLPDTLARLSGTETAQARTTAVVSTPVRFVEASLE